MNFDNENVAGLLLFFSYLQFLFVRFILALVEPGYSFSINYISELGIGPNALVFNLSVVIWGLSAFIAGVLLYRASATESIFPSRVFAILIMILGVAFTGVGLFPIYSYPSIYPIPLHNIFGTINIFTGIIVIFVSYKMMKSPLSYIQIILGVLAVLTNLLLFTMNHMGLGIGGIQRVAFLVLTVWVFIMSTYLMNKS